MDEKRCLLEKRSEVGSSAEHWSRLHAGASEVRMSANGSNPAHGDAIRRGVATQSAEVFALPLIPLKNPAAKVGHLQGVLLDNWSKDEFAATGAARLPIRKSGIDRRGSIH